MTTDTRPQWLIDACVEYMARPKFQPPTDGFTPGDLWMAQGESAGPRTFVCVTHYDDFHVDLVLCHTETDMATDFDLVYDAGEVAPWPVVACGELYGNCLWEQLVVRVGRIPADAAHAVERSALTDAETLDGYRTGMPLGHYDGRREFITDYLYPQLHDLRAPSLRCLLWDWV